MRGKRGEIHIEKVNFQGEFWIGVSAPFSFGTDENGNWCERSTNLRTKAFRKFMNQCVGSPNMTIFKDESLRDERYEKGKQILINAGYTLVEKG